jgi:hypothetical protein
VIPPGGVPTLIPSPSIRIARSCGASICSDSAPRTHFGTFTGITRTLLNPAAFICSADHAIAFSSPGDPLNRFPIRSQRYVSRL